MASYGTCSAFTEYERLSDAYGITDPEYVEVEVVFNITDPGTPPNPWGDDPGSGPDGEIVEVLEVNSYDPVCRRYATFPACAEIDAWARAPERFATLLQRAIDAWERDLGPDCDDARDRAIDDRLMGAR